MTGGEGVQGFTVPAQPRSTLRRHGHWGVVASDPGGWPVRSVCPARYGWCGGGGCGMVWVDGADTMIRRDRRGDHRGRSALRLYRIDGVYDD